ncbi:hypothetical protein HZH66_010802 [Vespula vulgaris]|uniref:Uncharacterized protein n=1 Tax=Vespula vulgaris TaxID=7454 RepID=A0A834MWN8_VESVU|nr:hypothetical protein HZH66_010802 [Vespula vulgaris]
MEVIKRIKKHGSSPTFDLRGTGLINSTAINHKPSYETVCTSRTGDEISGLSSRKGYIVAIMSEKYIYVFSKPVSQPASQQARPGGLYTGYTFTEPEPAEPACRDARLNPNVLPLLSYLPSNESREALEREDA